jgi:shikimate dehydrogenase
MTDTYAVIGNPVAHSKSPLIHAAFAAAESQAIVYERLFCALGAFNQTVDAFRARGGKGLNVTVPFKHEAYALCTCVTPRAREAGAVNVLSFISDGISGDNSDGAGLVRDITHNLGFDACATRALLLGAGGASFGVVGPLLETGIASLTIANRTVAKAVELRKRFAPHSNITACGYDTLAGQRYDLVINATSAGLANATPDLPRGLFSAGALAYDMVYGKDTPFMAFARGEGARVADGLGMLVEQAAESFLIWRGVRPQTAPVIRLLRDQA